jgi:azurin
MHVRRWFECCAFRLRPVVLSFHLSASIFLAALAMAADQATFFLPNNPVAAAYVLSRLSTRELIEAPRGEYVYVALLQRKGIDRKYRLEALEGLAVIRHSDRWAQCLWAITELDKKGQEAEEPLRELGSVFLQSSRAQILSHRAELDSLKSQAQFALTRQIAFAACLVADASAETSWGNAKANPTQLAELILAIPLLPDASLRATFYNEVKPLLNIAEPAELRRAAIRMIVTIPGHDVDTFQALAALILAGVEVPDCAASLVQLPRSSWDTQTLEPLINSLIHYLDTIPPEQRTGTVFTDVLQFANELASALPSDPQKTFIRTLRNLGPTIVTLHAVYEQMRFDKDTLVVATGKPVVIVFQNDDAMPHNVAVLAPGAQKEIGLAAEKMTPEPDAEGRLYIPASPKVLAATKLVAPGQKLQLAFNAPADEGDYPFICTFPGHWLRMAGILTVTRDLEAYLASHALAQKPKLTDWKLADFLADLPQATTDATSIWVVNYSPTSRVSNVINSEPMVTPLARI